MFKIDREKMINLMKEKIEEGYKVVEELNIRDKDCVTAIVNIFELEKTINDLDAKDVIIKAPNENYPNVDFIPSNIKMSIMAELISTKNAKEKVAMRWFVKNIETLKKYTHILIDLSPGTNIVNRNML